MKQIPKRLIWILIFATIIIILYPKKYEVDKAVIGNAISMENIDEITPIGITIKGVYRWHWLFNDTFEGQIVLEGYDITQEELSKITFDEKHGKYGQEKYGELRYRWEDNTSKQPRMVSEFPGFISMDRKGEDIIIALFSGWPRDYKNTNEGSSWSIGRKGTAIVYPKQEFEDIEERLYLHPEQPR